MPNTDISKLQETIRAKYQLEIWREKIAQAKEKFLPYALIAPSFLVFSLFMFWPLAQTVYLSFFKWNMIKPVKEFVWFDNYLAIFQNAVSYKVMLNTLWYIVILLVLNFVAPYILSFVLSVVIKRGAGFYRGVFFLPSVISLVVGSLIYLWILDPLSGPAAIAANFFGLVMPVWSKTEGFVIAALSLITSWKVFGYNFIVLLGGVAGVSKEIIEAAKVDNVPLRRIFSDLILPLSSSTAVYVFVMTIVQCLQYIFTPIKVLTQGGPDYASSNLIYNTYHHGFVLYETGVASAFAVLTMALFIFLLWLKFKFVERSAYYEN